MTQIDGKIDWTKPIELDDGTKVKVDRGQDWAGDYRICHENGEDIFPNWYCPNGVAYSDTTGNWPKVRNVQECDIWPSIEVATATLEAAGYTVTPPDPLAADREFLAGLFAVFGQNYTANSMVQEAFDKDIPAAMAYLRANKGRL